MKQDEMNDIKHEIKSLKLEIQRLQSFQIQFMDDYESNIISTVETLKTNIELNSVVEQSQYLKEYEQQHLSVVSV